MAAMKQRCFKLWGKVPLDQDQPTEKELEDVLCSFGDVQLWWPEYKSSPEHSILSGLVLYVNIPERVSELKNKPHHIRDFQFRVQKPGKSEKAITDRIHSRESSKEKGSIFYPSAGQGASDPRPPALVESAPAAMEDHSSAVPADHTVTVQPASAPDVPGSPAGAELEDVTGPLTTAMDADAQEMGTSEKRVRRSTRSSANTSTERRMTRSRSALALIQPDQTTQEQLPGPRKGKRNADTAGLSTKPRVTRSRSTMNGRLPAPLAPSVPPHPAPAASALVVDFTIGVSQARAFAIRAADEAAWSRYDRSNYNDQRKEDRRRLSRIPVALLRPKVVEEDLQVKKPTKTYLRKKK